MLFMSPRDIGLFLKSARTDAAIARMRRSESPSAAFEAAYRKSDDPWGSGSARYRYQRLKYDKIVALLPIERFGDVLELGCGTGLLTQRLAGRADRVLGLDLAPTAIIRARERAVAFANLRFETGDILNLPRSLDGGFDLVVAADVFYYLSPFDAPSLQALINRVADLLRPGGMCLLANHYFFAVDPDSRLSRKIHSAFSSSERFTVLSQHRRAFFLATVLGEVAQTP